MYSQSYVLVHTLDLLHRFMKFVTPFQWYAEAAGVIRHWAMNILKYGQDDEYIQGGVTIKPGGWNHFRFAQTDYSKYSFKPVSCIAVFCCKMSNLINWNIWIQLRRVWWGSRDKIQNNNYERWIIFTRNSKANLLLIAHVTCSTSNNMFMNIYGKMKPCVCISYVFHSAPVLCRPEF